MEIFTRINELIDKGQYDIAETMCTPLLLRSDKIEFRGKIAKLCTNGGFISIKQGLYEKADSFFRLAFKLEVDKLFVYPSFLHFCWNNWELRYKATEILRPFMKFWDGSYQKDATLLFICTSHQEGFGDCIKNIRFIYYFQKYFNKIKVLVPKQLTVLMQNSFSNLVNTSITFINSFEDAGEYDFTGIPHLNLFFDFSEDLPTKYLKPNIEKANIYKEKYFITEMLKVGICWKGSNIIENRNIDLKTLSKLFSLDKVQFYSLQKTDSEGIGDYPEIINLTPEFNNFDDTLAAMSNLDVVVTVDTAIANLAGAAGIKTFLMLHKDASNQWWGYDERTKLYDEIQIFRQKDPGNWNYVVENIEKRLLNEYIIG